MDGRTAAGLLYTGPFAARAKDMLGLAVGGTHVNSRIADVQRMQNALGTPTAVQTTEYVTEIFYNVHVGGWLDVRPNFQYVLHPGGTSQNPNNLIFGVRVAINL